MPIILKPFGSLFMLDVNNQKLYLMYKIFNNQAPEYLQEIMPPLISDILYIKIIITIYVFVKITKYLYVDWKS